jgi:hypothetical protein
MRQGSKGTMSKQSSNLQVTIIPQTEESRLNVKAMLTVFITVKVWCVTEVGKRGTKNLIWLFCHIYRQQYKRNGQNLGGNTAGFFIMTTLLHTQHSLFIQKFLMKNKNVDRTLEFWKCCWICCIMQEWTMLKGIMFQKIYLVRTVFHLISPRT